MEYTVELVVRAGPTGADPDLGDRLLSALERRPRLAAPVVSQDMASGRVSVTCCVEAADAWQAGAVVCDEVLAALAEEGVSSPVGELHVTAGEDELVTGAEIARRLGVTRERVRQWASSEQYGFPAAIQRLGSAKVWRWGDVLAWAARHGRGPGPEQATNIQMGE